MNLKFYVIYTPESFAILSTAIKSLLINTPYYFVLVGNGVYDNELSQIKTLVRQNSRLDYLDLPGSVTVPHGTALMHLLKHHDDDYFCFCDSDIFATKNVVQELEGAMSDSDVFSSCKPLEWAVKEDKRGYRGHCVTSPSGLNLAMTYFSIYKTEPLKTILNQHQISLERYMRPEQVPKQVAKLISTQDQHNWKFNTAKLANLMQAMSGMRLRYQEVDGLLHLGGISRYSLHNIEGTRSEIKKDNKIGLDRLSSRHYFYQLLERLSKDPFEFELPRLNLYQNDFQEVINNSSQSLICLYQEMSKINLEDI